MFKKKLKCKFLLLKTKKRLPQNKPLLKINRGHGILKHRFEIPHICGKCLQKEKFTSTKYVLVNFLIKLASANAINVKMSSNYFNIYFFFFFTHIGPGQFVGGSNRDPDVTICMTS